MHILFSLSSLSGGGAERVAINLCNYWSSVGIKITIVATAFRNSGADYQINDNIKIILLSETKLYNKKNIFSQIYRLISFRKIIRTENPDIIISFLTRVNLATIFAAHKLNKPVIISERVYPPAEYNDYLTQLLRKIFYRQATLIVLQTGETLKWFKENLKLTNLTVIKNPLILPVNSLGPQMFLSDKNLELKKIILSVGRLEHQKGFDILLTSYSEIIHNYPDWHLVIIGKGSLESKLKLIAKQLNIHDRVTFLGSVGNIDYWYKKSSIFILTSRYEGFPNVLVEAMAYGLAVISIDCKCGPSEIITNGHNGLLVPENLGFEGVKSSLVRLINDEAFRKNIGINALLVKDVYSTKYIGDQWLTTFKRFLIS